MEGEDDLTKPSLCGALIGKFLSIIQYDYILGSAIAVCSNGFC